MANSSCFEPSSNQRFCGEADLEGHLYCIDPSRPRILAIDCQRCGETVVRLVGGVRIREALTRLGITEEVVDWPTPDITE